MLLREVTPPLPISWTERVILTVASNFLGPRTLFCLMMAMKYELLLKINFSGFF
jgi:hypothetical protein